MSTMISRFTRLPFPRMGCLILALIPFLGFSQTGPGGVSATDGISALQVWLDANDLDGDGIYEGAAESGISTGLVNNWRNKSGHAGRDVNTGNFPNYISAHSGLNNMPVASFVAGSSHYLSSAGNVQLAPSGQVTLFYVADDQAFCSACSLFNWRLAAGNVGGLAIEGTTAAYTTYGYNSGWPGVNGSGYSTTNSYILSAQYATSGWNQVRDGTTVGTAAGNTINNVNAPYGFGRNFTTSANYLTVKLAEVIVYNGTLNSAQHIIVNNYLAAKYGISLTANDLYVQDNTANGDFDFEVAGIGRVNSTNIHSDAKGGMVRILNPGGLGDNEFLLWGHNNGATSANETVDVPAGLDGRLNRVWRASEVNAAGTAVDVGTTDVRFDLAGLGTINVAHLRLLVDTDNDGVFSDETPVSGATNVSGSIYQFAGVTQIANNTRFTLATASHATPLNGVRTFYSLATGAWEANTSWSRASDGSTGALTAGEFPLRTDNVVIRTGHNITIDNVADNGSAGIRPDDLASPNIGPFGASNLFMFYQTGSIQINGTLTVSGVEIMTGGYTRVATGGTLTTASNLVNVSYLEAETGSTLATLDDIVLTGNSTTIINTNSTSADDLIIDHTDATLCGTGSSVLQNGSGSSITYANGGTINQVCTTYTISCTGTGCAGTFPAVGTSVVVSGNTGPGGVGSSAGTSSLNYWYKADANITLASGAVSSWGDASGRGNTLTAPAGNRPTSVISAALNNQPVVRYNAASSQYFIGPASPTGPGVDNLTLFVVANGTSYQSLLRFQDGAGTFVVYPWEIGSPTRAFIVSSDGGTGNGLASGLVNSVNNVGGARYRINTATTGMQTFLNGALVSQRTSVNATLPSQRLYSGRYAAGSEFPTCDVGEMMVYYSALNDAQMVIVQNYLAAKFNASLSSDDAYTMDNTGNGDFDLDVAGIGRASNATSHRDSRGTGIVRMWNPGDLNNGEYLMWGSTNATLSSSTTTVGTSVDGTVIKERLTRVWRVSETGDVGTVSISFELSGLSPTLLGSNLRLMVDHDADGFADNDVPPIVGSFSNNVVTFSYNFSTGDRFTLGNISATLALPIELTAFDASQVEDHVLATWRTSAEINNDYFLVERSPDGEHWERLAKITGAGTTKETRDYEAVDEYPIQGINYYRLKQTDYDGQSSYSKIVSVKFEGSGEFLVAPNPTTGRLSIHGSKSEIDQVKLYNIQGVVLKSGVDTELDLTALPAGIYLVRVFHRNGVSISRVVKY
jgi:hypothetical protein